jgi:uncharacterized membrane protein
MSPRVSSDEFRRVAYVIVIALVIVYAWLATGAKPFHALSYALISIPILIVVAVYVMVRTFYDERSGVSHYFRRRSLGLSSAHTTPWLVVLVGAIILEIVGLALGGRSKRVPTLSTEVDHLLTTHWLRCVLFLAWLAVGVAPLRRLNEHRRSVEMK